MNISLEHVEAVKTRIESIRRRFVDVAEPSPPAFDAALRKATAPRTTACPGDIESLINQSADRYGVDSAVVKAVINAESSFRQSAVSRSGALGLMQLMPGTAQALGVDPMDPAQNIDGGVRYLRTQLDKFGSLELALAAYNAGPGSVSRYGGVPPYAETRNYVEKVLRTIENYR